MMPFPSPSLMNSGVHSDPLLLDLSGVSSGTIAVIPTGRLLVIRGVIRSQRGASVSSMLLRFNGDAGANYLWQRLLRSETSNGADYQSSPTGAFVVFCPAATAPGDAAATFETIIPLHKSTDLHKYGVTRTGVHYGATTSNNAEVQCAAWSNAAAISSITAVETNGSLFAHGSYLKIEVI